MDFTDSPGVQISATIDRIALLDKVLGKSSGGLVLSAAESEGSLALSIAIPGAQSVIIFSTLNRAH